MSDANDKAGAKPMPVSGAACGIKPSKEAMEVDFGVDFSKAKEFLTPEPSDESSSSDKSETKRAETKPS